MKSSNASLTVEFNADDNKTPVREAHFYRNENGLTFRAELKVDAKDQDGKETVITLFYQDVRDISFTDEITRLYE